MNLNSLIGQEITARDREANAECTRPHKYIIVEAFPYMVKGIRICENGAQIAQCFSIGDLVTEGLIKVKSIPHTQGYRFVRKNYEGKL